MKRILDGDLPIAAAATVRQKLMDATKIIQRTLSGVAPNDATQTSGDTPARPEGPATGVAAILNAFAPPNAGALKAASVGQAMHIAQSGLMPVRGPGFGPNMRPAPEVPTPPGARFLAKTFVGPAGSREYKLFIPSSVKNHAGARLPLIVMLHGCTQNPDDFAVGTGMNEIAEQRGLLVAYPKQPTSSNSMACWNWFNQKDQMRDCGEPAILAGMTHAIMAEFGVDADRIFVAGLSAGGAMAAILGETYPDLFAAAGIHSGLPYKAATDVGSAFESMRNGAKAAATPLAAAPGLRTIVFHGDADRTVNPSNGELIAARARAGLKGVKEKTIEGRSAGGVPYTRTVFADKRGAPRLEYWRLEGMGHAWSGGSAEGSYTDPKGPDASNEMARFFLD